PQVERARRVEGCAMVRDDPSRYPGIATFSLTRTLRALYAPRELGGRGVVAGASEHLAVASPVLQGRRNYRRKLRTIVALVGCLICAAAHAKTNVEELGWFQISGTGPIVGNWKLFLEAQPRVGTDAANGDTNFRALVLRSAIGYQITEPWSLWAGYAYIPSFNPSRHEQRAFQQSLVVTNAGPFKIVNRTRFEE